MSPITAHLYAVRAHGDQRYGDLPYEAHLQAVVDVLRDFHYSDRVQDAGWLHDVLEDTATDPADIGRIFGEGVLSVVEACTGRGTTRSERAADIARKIEADPRAAPVKLADRIANVEAAKPGDKHAARYLAEQPLFEAVIRPRVPIQMWTRLAVALAGLATEMPNTKAAK